MPFGHPVLLKDWHGGSQGAGAAQRVGRVIIYRAIAVFEIITPDAGPALNAMMLARS